MKLAAAKVNEKLKGRVLVDLTVNGNRKPLFELVRDKVGGRLSESTEILENRRKFSISILVSACKRGSKTSTSEFELPSNQSDRIAKLNLKIIMQIEELELPPATTTTIRLNTAADANLLYGSLLKTFQIVKKPPLFYSSRRSNQMRYW